MTVRQWIASELLTSSEFDLWHRCWRETHGAPCKSNRIILDLDRWRRHQFVPDYVWSCFERAKAKARVLPKNCDKVSRWAGAYHRGVPTEALKLVDSSPILFAHKDKDGVWRA